MKKRKKLSKNMLKNVIPLGVATLMMVSIFVGYKIMTRQKEKSFLENIDSSTYAYIDHYAIYGIHMNIAGSFTLTENPQNISLVLANGKEEITLPWETTKENNKYTFKTSNYINEGINLEKLPEKELYLLIKADYLNEDNKNVTKYYSVKNNSKYDRLEYYTLTKNQKNNKITIEWNTYEECPTLRFQIKETKLPEDVYDITIDPGHDVTDPGKTVCLNNGRILDPTSNGYCPEGTMYKENNMNLYVAKALKEKLENLGYKVIMTRNTEEDKVNIYTPYGSATMANDTKSKFSLAIHHNSSGVSGGDKNLKGYEVYVANDITFDLAEQFVESLKEETHMSPSPKEKYAIEPGIYQRFFTESEILEDDVQPSNKTTNNIYYYYIREVGGISTHATNDGRYANIGPYYYQKNEHYDSNNTAEPYLFELGYMDNVEDLNNINQNREGYANALANAIQKYLEQE